MRHLACRGTDKTETFDDSPAAGWKQGTMGVGFDENDTYQPLIGLDLLSEMVDVNASLYCESSFPSMTHPPRR